MASVCVSKTVFGISKFLIYSYSHQAIGFLLIFFLLFLCHIPVHHGFILSWYQLQDLCRWRIPLSTKDLFLIIHTYLYQSNCFVLYCWSAITRVEICIISQTLPLMAVSLLEIPAAHFQEPIFLVLKNCFILLLLPVHQKCKS